MNQNAPKHFFISYNKADRTWAEWIAWQLEEVGYTTIIQAWDFRPGMNIIHKMQEATQEAERTIAVLSTHYLQALYTYPEWEAALKQDPQGEKGILIPIRIQECNTPGLLGNISYIDLVGLDEMEAKEALLDGIRQGRNKPPTAPLFPGSISETQRAVSQQPSFPGAFPPIETIENVPYFRNPYFTGRDTILQNLHEALNKHSATAITQGHAMSGLGGIGKTQTAVEYTYRYHSEYHYIFWVRAEKEVELQTGFVEIARLLDLPEKDTKNPTDTVQAVKHWLERNEKWLLVFDNADTPKLLKAYYPRTPRGRILLTSRTQIFDTLGIARPLALEKMDPEEALGFLFKRAGREQGDPKEKNAAGKLAFELGYLPLALEQAAAYITEKSARFQDYLTSFQKQGLSLLKKADPKTGEYPASVAKTWALNFQEVEKDPVPADILRVSAFLSPDAIPFELLNEGASQLGLMLAESLDSSEDPLVLNEALEPLARYSLIRLDVDNQTYSMHRMVQEAVKDQMGADEQAEWAERIVRAVQQSFPEVDYQTWSRCERLIPHALLCAEHIDHWGMTSWKAQNLLFQTGVYFYQRGQYGEADPLLKSALTICEEVLGPEHPDTLSTVNNLAILYWNQGKYEEAELLFQRALEASERVLGSEHPDTLSTVNNLAGLYSKQGKYEQAEPLFQRALTSYERVLGINHPTTILVRNNYSILQEEMKQKAEAERSKPRGARKRTGK